MSPSRSGSKRRGGGHGGSPISRTRKKQKRLDAIVDKPTPLLLDSSSDDDAAAAAAGNRSLRRSSRARRAPVILDSSPVPSNRFKKPKPSHYSVPVSPQKREKQSKKEEEEEEEEEDWRSRLRYKAKEEKVGGNGSSSGRVSRKGKVRKKKKKEKRVSTSVDEIEKKEEDDDIDSDVKIAEKEEKKEEDGNVGASDLKVLEASEQAEKVKIVSDLNEQAEEANIASGLIELESSEQGVEVGAASDAKELEAGERANEGKDASDDARELESSDDVRELDSSDDVREMESSDDVKELGSSEEGEEDREDEGDECTNAVREEEEKEQQEQRQEAEKVVAVDNMDTKSNEKAANGNAFVESEKAAKENDMALPMSEGKISSKRVKEGRRCGLCGGGTDGKPPKKLVRESVESDNEAYEGSSASEEPNYDIWDGFGDEPGWLGRLLGPIHDRFGIARVWVHQHCAVWSPEVYFAGLGCLKNVRAALCRGRALKCSRCGRPGATIGCRVDRCPKTYHLPCSRAEGCIFDHRKFLIACHDHGHLFQPQGVNYSHQIRKRKARKLKLEMRKLSNDAWRKDLEAEEKWLEHCGEDEEFLKREGKRLHRDILRIAPTYIGGSSENEKLYQGWESVAGLRDVIRCMKEVVILPLLYPEFFSNIGLTPPRGVLLHGYPGTGKTLVVRALIGECSRGGKRIAYFARKGADCLGKYVGDAERQLRLLFQVAEKSQPSIIFFDEIDGLAPCRSRHQDQTHSSVVSTLLSLLDGLKSRGSVIVIGATNRPDAVDPALRRPGRFDREIYFPLPSEDDRSAILSLHTRTWPYPLSGTLLSWIAKKTVGYAGADLKALCTQAAMSALKRNCALKELLSSAEKGFVHGKLPSLPTLIVEERDWLDALALAPPPCSRREAGMAANDVVSSPLSAHLTPCLIKPLSLLLISFCNEERIWLPPVLYKASKSIRNIIISFLEERKLPIASWRSHVTHLVQEKCIVKELQGALSHYGLVIDPSGGRDSFLSDDDNDEHEKPDSFTFGLSGKSMNRFPFKQENSSGGFRVLISGSPRCGQQHLASCLLHGFMGHIEIQKVNLATISQEGHGDLFRGLTQIISKCLNLGRCIIYMPRIDLWSINENSGEDNEESQTTPITSKSSVTKNEGRYTVSDIWNSFVEEVESACKSASLIIMATCEIETQDLPLGIKQFFGSDVMNADSAPALHTIPRFFVHIEGSFDHELIINSSAAKLSHDLVRTCIQLVHQKTHPCRSQDKIELPNSSEINSEAPRQSIENWEKTGLVDSTAYPDQTACNHQQLFPKNLHSKVTRGSSVLAIATFGYQILRGPQFAELCWATSKLREGPCTDVTGPWKSWPFNSCVMQGSSSSPDKAIAEGNTSVHKSKVNSGVVRGLTAVGLLSYRGVYTSVMEVAVEVRKVLELLVGQIQAKIVARKDRYQYLRLLSQVAYIEDMVNNWAYTYQSSHMHNPTPDTNTKPAYSGVVSTEKKNSGSNITGVQPCVPSIPDKSYNGEQAALHTKSYSVSAASNGHCVLSGKGLSDDSLLQSDMNMIPDAELTQEGVSSFLPSSVHLSEGPPLDKGMADLEQFNGSEIAGITSALDDPNSSLAKSSSKDVGVYCNGSGTVCSPTAVDLVSEKPCEATIFTLIKDDNILAASERSCLYNCCSGCLQKLYILAHDVLSECWEPSGHRLTADDIDHIVSSCSLNILAALRKFNISENCSNLAVYKCRTAHSDHCACRDGTTENTGVQSVECSCHVRNDEGNSNGETECHSLLQQGLTFFFRKGVLVSTDPQKDEVLHCRYDKFCLCFMLEMMLTMKKPSDLSNSVAL